MFDDIATPIKGCRCCGSKDIDDVLSLGDQFVSDFVAYSQNSVRAPLELVRCRSCNLIQLRHTFSRQKLYKHYWYRSGISPTMRQALSELVQKSSETANLAPGDMVVDVGCNDGTLLRSYEIPGLSLVGFEPAENLMEDARRGTTWIFNDFFSSELFLSKFESRKPRVVTSVAMFYDLDDPNSFVAGINKILPNNGIWVVQQNYLATMLEQNGFDNIGHEHLEYYSLGTMQSLLDRHGLEVFDAEVNDVNGGSFRTFIGRKGSYQIQTSVRRMYDHERKLGLDEQAAYERFAANIKRIKSEVHGFIAGEVRRGKTVYVYGASNRGNTILQYCELDHKLVKKATDANPEKWGRKTAGTLIPIISKEEARRERPDYFLILPHHFLNEIERDESKYLSSGGKLIVPLPEFRLVTKT